MPDRKHTRWMRIRLQVVVGFLVVCSAFVLVRIFNLQVRQSEWLRELSRQQYLKEITLEPMRGSIEDRNGAPLAVSVMTESVFAMPGEMQETDASARMLAEALGKDSKWSARLARKLSSRKHFTWVARRLPPRKVERVKALEIKGVHFTTESRRYYPARELAAALIGFAGDGRGLEGIELLFDGQLRGSTVFAQGLRDARGNLLYSEGVGNHGGTGGGGVTLTIDGAVQEIAERVLQKTLIESRAKNAVAIVMVPSTGELLAVANVPSFNPNTFWEFGPRLYRNRAVADCYEPGSTMKVFTMAAALAAKEIELTEKVDCKHGVYEIGAHTIHDSHRGGFGLLTADEVLKHSSNIGIAQIGQRLGRQRLFSALRRFGFGKRTGIDVPGESRCRLRPPESWSAVGLATISFGQGVSVTPLQMITALSAVANGGVWMRPLIIKEIRAPSGQVVESFGSDPGGRVLEPEVAEELTRMMVEVTGPGGTGQRAAVEGFKVAGKTGTAQKVDPIAGGYSQDKRVASFMGFVPASRPRVAILVVVDEPESSPYGGVVAAPAFSEIASATLRYLGVYHGQRQSGVVEENLVSKAGAEGGGRHEARVAFDVSTVDSTAASSIETLPGRIPDLQGLSVRQAIRILRERGLAAMVSGSGKVRFQRPRAGEPVESVKTVELTLERCAGRDCVSGTELAELEGSRAR